MLRSEVDGIIFFSIFVVSANVSFTECNMFVFQMPKLHQTDHFMMEVTFMNSLFKPTRMKFQ